MNRFDLIAFHFYNCANYSLLPTTTRKTTTMWTHTLLITMLGCSAATATSFCVLAGVMTEVNLMVPEALASQGKVDLTRHKQVDRSLVSGGNRKYSFEVKSDNLYGSSSRVTTNPIGFVDSQKRANVAHAHVQLPFLPSSESYRL